MLNNNSLMDEVTPLEFLLSQNYPNPFKEKTVIKYCVPYKTRVVITILNSKGKEIEKLVDEEKNPGTYKTEFIPASGGRILKEGEYFCCIQSGDYKKKIKMILEDY